MDRSFLSHASQNNADRLLEFFTDRQHVHPHSSIGTILNQAAESYGVCSGAIAQAMRWLQLDESRPIGRLRRTELTQLVRSIHRYWQQNTAQAASHDAPQPQQY